MAIDGQIQNDGRGMRYDAARDCALAAVRELGD